MLTRRRLAVHIYWHWSVTPLVSLGNMTASYRAKEMQSPAPVGDDSVLNGVLKRENTTLWLGLIANIGILLAHAHHHALHKSNISVSLFPQMFLQSSPPCKEALPIQAAPISCLPTLRCFTALSDTYLRPQAEKAWCDMHKNTHFHA